MSRATNHRNKYPSHWPIQVTGLPSIRHPLPPPGRSTLEMTGPAAHNPADGTLTASAWIGLHYASEDG